MKELEHLRGKIDALNELLVSLIAKRLEIAEEIAHVKRRHALSIYDPNREKKQRLLLQNLAAEYHLDPQSLERIFDPLIEYSKRVQEKEIDR